MKPEGYRAIFWAGLFAGILDLTAAITISVLHGRTPVQLLQLVASGWFGAEAYAGGLSVALLGALFHFMIAFTASAVYYAISLRLNFICDMPVLSGVIYGIAVYHFMNYVVLPLSAYPHPASFAAGLYIRGILVHIFCVGLPISIAVSRYAKRSVPREVLVITS